MPIINQIQDAELARQKRNQTESQKRNAELTKEGVLVNSLIKDSNSLSMSELCDSLIISDNIKLPEKIYEPKTTKEKSIVPISLVSVGVMGVMALASAFARRNLKVNSEVKEAVKKAKKLPTLTRNLAINEETHQAIYQMVQAPNQKTVLAGLGVLTVSAMAFMGKMFLDGYKQVWVKKREADIQKNLQENLIAVETQSFSGKIQIIRNMLSEKAREFNDYLALNSKRPSAFSNFKSRPFFTGKSSGMKERNDSDLKYFALGALTLFSIVGLGYSALKNLTAGKKYLEKGVKKTISKLTEIIEKSTDATKEADKVNIKNMLESLGEVPQNIKKKLSEMNWQDGKEREDFIGDVVFNTTKSTAQANEALGGDGTPKPAFYSHVNDYRAFLYNYLLDTSNPFFKSLFLGVTGVTAISYGGSVAGEAVKEVQVKKMNAETELELQQRLVATELRNFKAKKDAAIDPLCEEFYVQLRKGKPREELKTMAENILFEVKNGPPFVYS